MKEMIALIIEKCGEENRKTIDEVLKNQRWLLAQAEDRLEEKLERWAQKFQERSHNN